MLVFIVKVAGYIKGRLIIEIMANIFKFMVSDDDA